MRKQMNNTYSRLVMLLSSFLLCLPSALSSEKSGNSATSQIETLSKMASQLDFSPVQLDFSEFWQSIHKRDKEISYSDVLKLQQQLSVLKQTIKPNNYCDVAQLNELEFFVSLVQERQKLLRSTNKDKKYSGSIKALDNGNQWYQHLLKSWLLSEVSIASLKKIAQSEIDAVKQKRLALQQTHLKGNDTKYHLRDRKGILSAFRKREQSVNAKVSSVFGTGFIAPQVNIEKSSLPDSFPAPGIYNGYTQTFLYHLHGEYFPEKHMDWLYLHEATPGHHYQARFADKHAKCASLARVNSTTAYSEGWGAYVETLGGELGLYKDKDSILYALDWQIMRAVRVLLDIGIHYDGWSDEQARELWMDIISEQKDIMNREINRIRRWPIQVITYVYGKATIEEAIAKLAANSNKANAHKRVLELSNLSLHSLQASFQVAD